MVTISLLAFLWLVEYINHRPSITDNNILLLLESSTTHEEGLVVAMSYAKRYGVLQSLAVWEKQRFSHKNVDLLPIAVAMNYRDKKCLPALLKIEAENGSWAEMAMFVRRQAFPSESKTGTDNGTDLAQSRPSDFAGKEGTGKNKGTFLDLPKNDGR